MIAFTEFPNATESAQQLAHTVAQDLRYFLTIQAHATLAVSGGKSPIAFFQALSQCDVDWSHVFLTLVDERLVPTQHEDSNTRLVRQYLQQNQAQSAQWLPVVCDNADERWLKNPENALSFAMQHYRQPDVIVLGMGNDGHTASIFPNAPQFADAVRRDYPAPLLHISPISAPYERISMTLASIESASRVYLAIAGAEKLAVYHQAAQNITAQFPISYVLHSDKVNPHVFYHR